MPSYPTSQTLYQPVTNPRGYGKAMAAILPKQRAFVIAFVETGGQSASKAARISGYGGTPSSTRVAASRLMHDEGVLAAIREETDKKLRGSLLLGFSALEEIAKDAFHKDRLKAATELLNRGGLLLATTHNVNVNVSTPQGDKEVLDKITVLAARLGLDPQLLIGKARGSAAPVEDDAIDADWEDVEDDTPTSDGLEDLL